MLAPLSRLKGLLLAFLPLVALSVGPSRVFLSQRGVDPTIRSEPLEVRVYDVRLIEEARVPASGKAKCKSPLLGYWETLDTGWGLLPDNELPLPLSSEAWRPETELPLQADWQEIFERFLPQELEGQEFEPQEFERQEFERQEFERQEFERQWTLRKSPLGRVVLKADSATHDRVAQFLSILEAHFTHRMQLVFYQLTGREGLAAKSVMTAEEVEAVLQSAHCVPFATRIVRAHSTEFLASTNQQSYVASVQHAIQMPDLVGIDPLILVLPEGLNVAVELHPRADRRTTVRLTGRWCSGRKFRNVTRSIREAGEAIQQMPALRTACFSASADLEDGGGLSFGLSSPENSSPYWLVVAKTMTAPPLDSPLLSTGASLEPPLALRAKPPVLGTDAGQRLAYPYLEPDELAPRQERIEALLLARFAAKGQSTTAPLVEWFGNWALAKDSLRVSREEVERELRELSLESDQCLGFEVRFGELPRADSPSTPDLDVLAERLRGRALGSAPLGGCASLSNLHEFGFPWPAGADSAGSSWASDIEASVAQAGITLNCSLLELRNKKDDGSSRATVEIDLHIQRLDRASEKSLPPAAPTARGPLPSAVRANVRGLVEFEDSGWKLVGSTALEDQAGSTFWVIARRAM